MKKTTERIIAIVCGAGAFIGAALWASAVRQQENPGFALVAATDLPASHTLARADANVVEIPKKIIPKTAFRNVDKIQGLILAHALSKGQLITSNDTATVAADVAGLAIPDGLEALVIPSSWTAGPIPGVRAHDTVSIIASGPNTREARNNTALIAGHIPVANVRDGSDGSAQSLTLILPQDVAERILSFRANNYLLEIILDGIGK